VSERRATLLLVVSCLVLMTGAFVGLAEAGANGPTLSLAMIIPLILCSYGISRIVMHYGESGRRKR
jgi:uncharacterized membrane protein